MILTILFFAPGPRPRGRGDFIIQTAAGLCLCVCVEAGGGEGVGVGKVQESAALHSAASDRSASISIVRPSRC